MLKYVWMISWSQLAQSMLAVGLESFCVLYWYVWITYYFFQVWISSHFALLVLGLCWDTVDMSTSLPSDKLIELQQLVFCYRGNLLHSMRVCPFWAVPPFVPMDMHNFASCVV